MHACNDEQRGERGFPLSFFGSKKSALNNIQSFFDCKPNFLGVFCVKVPDYLHHDKHGYRVTSAPSFQKTNNTGKGVRYEVSIKNELVCRTNPTLPQVIRDESVVKSHKSHLTRNFSQRLHGSCKWEFSGLWIDLLGCHAVLGGLQRHGCQTVNQS
jgi:hypothetical protein